jgi:hypothetical protein
MKESKLFGERVAIRRFPGAGNSGYQQYVVLFRHAVGNHLWMATQF